MIIYICKFLHLISLFIAGGGGIGSAVIQSIYKKEGKVPEPHLARGFKVLAFDDPFFYQTSGYHGTVEKLTSYPTEECFAYNKNYFLPEKIL